jgi:hypothetical protein
MDFIHDISDKADQLKEDYELTDFEALQIAAKVQQTSVFADAMMLYNGQNAPSALEALSMALGLETLNGKSWNATLPGAIEKIAEALEGNR